MTTLRTDANVDALRTKVAALKELKGTPEALKKAGSLITALYANTPLAPHLPDPTNLLSFVLEKENRGLSFYTVKADLDLSSDMLGHLCESDKAVLGSAMTKVYAYCDFLAGEAMYNPMKDQAVGGCAAALLNTMFNDENMSIADVKTGLEAQNLPVEFIRDVLHRLAVVTEYLVSAQ